MSTVWYETVTKACPLFGDYVEDIITKKLARALPNNVIMMPSDKVKNSLILVEHFSSDIWFCPECDDCSTLNMIQNNAEVKKEDCKHTFAAKILTGMSKENDLDLQTKDQVFVVARIPSFVAVVYPQKNRLDSKGAHARPGVIEKTTKMSKHRCRTCKGREGCFHLVIFNLAIEEDITVNNHESVRLAEKGNKGRKTNVETDLIGDDAKLDGKGKVRKSKSKKLNPLNPENFNGAAANVFHQKFEYPPSKEDTMNNNKINKEQTLFPNKMMIPPGLGNEKCSCGNTFEILALESRNPVIHHSKPTKDSRTSVLSIHCLKTSHCDCKSYYHGEKDKLVRTSAAPSHANDKVHFVTVDLLNEYMCSLFGKSQEGKSIDAFINNKNILNSEERGEDLDGNISKQVFLKAFEIYINATQYNTEDAFGCSKCPGELLKGETEDDFENIEVHISDGIDMGNMQYPTKGMVGQDLFRVPKVTSGLAMLYQHF